MKVSRGFLTRKDPDTKKEIPFFVKVRSKDIIVTTAIKIDSADGGYLKKTSGMFDLINEYHGHDFSSYTYKISYSGKTAGTQDEVTYEKYLSGSLQAIMTYKLFRDGTYEVSIEASGSYWDNSASERIIKINLPYEVPFDTSIHYNRHFVMSDICGDMQQLSFKQGNIISSYIKKDEIENSDLYDGKMYYRTLEIEFDDNMLNYLNSQNYYTLSLSSIIKGRFSENSLEY